MDIDSLLDGVSGVEIGAARARVRQQQYSVDNLLCGFTALAALAAAGGTATSTCSPTNAIKPKHLLVDVSMAIGAVGLTSWRVGKSEQLIGSGPIPCSALQRDQTFALSGDTIQTTPGATLEFVNNTAATAVADANICVVGPSAV